MYGTFVKSDTCFYRTFRIKKELCSSNNGAVYMAWHKRLRRYVVIKVLKDYSAGSLETHCNEFEAIKNIKSQYIPQVFDFITENNNSYTIIEYIEGESFDKLLKRGHVFTEKQIVKWYIQLVSALVVIHTHNICHRDIKPANIILTSKDDVCLIDFGSAYVSGNNTGIISQSMGYASPEQYEYFNHCKSIYGNENKVFANNDETVLLAHDCKTETAPVENIHISNELEKIDWKLSDIYSLGATMYYLLTGNRPPVRSEEIVCVPKLKRYSKELLDIIKKSMKTNPSERYVSVEDIEKTLFSLQVIDSF